MERLYTFAPVWDVSAVRFSWLLLASALTGLNAGAQEQEKKLIDRIMRPDTSLSVSEQNKGYYGGKGFNGAGKAPVKDFQYTDKVRPKDFATTGYNGTKTWAGDFKFSAQTANTTTRTIIPGADKQYGTTALPVKDSRESGKGYATRESSMAQPFLQNGKSQKVLDQQSAATKPMTIDDVRELLNKSK